MLETLRLEDQRTEPPRLEMRFNVRSELGKKLGKLPVIVRGNVRLHPDLQNTEDLVLQRQGDMQERGREFDSAATVPEFRASPVVVEPSVAAPSGWR
jgi:hypothetical protein